MKEDQTDPLPEKNTFKNPNLIRVKVERNLNKKLT